MEMMFSHNHRPPFSNPLSNIPCHLIERNGPDMYLANGMPYKTLAEALDAIRFVIDTRKEEITRFSDYGDVIEVTYKTFETNLFSIVQPDCSGPVSLLASYYITGNCIDHMFVVDGKVYNSLAKAFDALYKTMKHRLQRIVSIHQYTDGLQVKYIPYDIVIHNNPSYNFLLKPEYLQVQKFVDRFLKKREYHPKYCDTPLQQKERAESPITEPLNDIEAPEEPKNEEKCTKMANNALRDRFFANFRLDFSSDYCDVRNMSFNKDDDYIIEEQYYSNNEEEDESDDSSEMSQSSESDENEEDEMFSQQSAEMTTENKDAPVQISWMMIMENLLCKEADKLDEPSYETTKFEKEQVINNIQSSMLLYHLRESSFFQNPMEFPFREQFESSHMQKDDVEFNKNSIQEESRWDFFLPVLGENNDASQSSKDSNNSFESDDIPTLEMKNVRELNESFYDKEQLSDEIQPSMSLYHLREQSFFQSPMEFTFWKDFEPSNFYDKEPYEMEFNKKLIFSSRKESVSNSVPRSSENEGNLLENDNFLMENVSDEEIESVEMIFDEHKVPVKKYVLKLTKFHDYAATMEPDGGRLTIDEDADSLENGEDWILDEEKKIDEKNASCDEEDILAQKYSIDMKNFQNCFTISKLEDGELTQKDKSILSENDVSVEKTVSIDDFQKDDVKAPISGPNVRCLAQQSEKKNETTSSRRGNNRKRTKSEQYNNPTIKKILSLENCSSTNKQCVKHSDQFVIIKMEMLVEHTQKPKNAVLCKSCIEANDHPIYRNLSEKTIELLKQTIKQFFYGLFQKYDTQRIEQIMAMEEIRIDIGDDSQLYKNALDSNKMLISEISEICAIKAIKCDCGKNANYRITAILKNEKMKEIRVCKDCKYTKGFMAKYSGYLLMVLHTMDKRIEHIDRSNAKELCKFEERGKELTPLQRKSIYTVFNMAFFPDLKYLSKELDNVSLVSNSQPNSIIMEHEDVRVTITLE